MSEISEHFERAETRRELLTGSAREWYDNILGKDFDCNCGESFTVLEKHVGISSGGDLPSTMDKLKHRVLGKSAYDVSSETVEDGLFTEDGMLVQGYVKCPYCLYQHGHHHDYLQSQGRDFQPPQSEYSELTGK